MNPVLSEEQIKETVKKIADFIQNQKGKITNKENWGLKKLKYPIQKKKTGFYCLIQFNTDGQNINSIETELKRDERIIRWQTVKLDKFSLEYAERRRNKLANEKNN